MTNTRRQILTAAAALPFACQEAWAQADSTIRISVGFPPGGSGDLFARILAEAMHTETGRAVVVENKPGGGGMTVAINFLRAPKDGNQLMLATGSTAISAPISRAKPPYNSVEDFQWIALLSNAPFVIAIHPSIPANNLKEFIAYAKANPTKLNYASQGNGSVSHIGTEVFKQKFGIEVVHVPYKGSGAAIADVLAGQVQLFITTPPSVMGHVQTGKLKALAVTSKKRHPMMPDVPTVAEAGVSNFELESWVALYVASDTPNAVITTLSSAVEKALSLAETKKRADLAGIELRYLTPTRMTAMLNKEIAETAIAIKAAKITLD